MVHQLMKLAELGHLLDYTDTRSIESWCSKNRVPVMIAGKQKYVLPVFVERYFQSYVRKFVTANYENPETIMEAIETNDSIRLSDLLDSPKSLADKKPILNTVEHSKEATDFLKTIKSAKNG